MPRFPWHLLLLLPALPADARTWTDRTGQYHAEGEMVGAAGQKIWLSTADEDLLLLPIDQFSPADQQYARSQFPRFRVPAPPEVPGAPAVHYKPGRQVAVLANTAIDESSGIACSRRRPGVFWTHNDSGDEPRLYAFDERGRDLGWCEITGVMAFDWEDIASVTLEGKNYLLVGDMGNNGMNAAVQMIYVVEEPEVDPQRGVLVKKVPVKQIIHFSYDDDFRNCEALAIDPTSKTFLLASKENRLGSYVYALPWPEDDPKKCFVARKIAKLPIPKVTGMDVSPDGRRAILLTYGDAHQYVRRPNETWADAFRRPGSLVELPPREQGESISYAPDGKTLWLTSEKLPTSLIKVSGE